MPENVQVGDLLRWKPDNSVWRVTNIGTAYANNRGICLDLGDAPKRRYPLDRDIGITEFGNDSWQFTEDEFDRWVRQVRERAGQQAQE